MTPGAGRAAAAARRDRSRRQGRRVLRPAVRQQRAAGAQADLPPHRDGAGDREAVGGLRARDRHAARGRGAGARGRTERVPARRTVDRAAPSAGRCARSSPQRGFHGASMSAVAAEAGVATGTAYTHYASKDELVLAAYLETKAELGAAATGGLDPSGRRRRRRCSARCGCDPIATSPPTPTARCSSCRSTHRPTAAGPRVAMDRDDDPLARRAGSARHRRAAAARSRSR